MTEILKEMAPGDKGRVRGYTPGSSAYRKRLLAMGLTQGTEFTVKRVAPMGDPVEIEVRGFALSLRKDEASALMVDKEDNHG
ncbi:MAG: ferrous iron transport protein A [Deltaproteobacteria bacterium]|nr:ferrous iron transport protein A [Deltaproteobacteria bacterium]